MKHLYSFVLGTFIVFLLVINIVCFFTGFNGAQLTNLFYLSERTISVGLLAEHILFESGVVIKQTSTDALQTYVNEISDEFQVDRNLVHSIIVLEDKGDYTIGYDGAIGRMKVQPRLLSEFPGLDPYNARDNIYMGVVYLSALLESESSPQLALEKYFTPLSRTIYNRDRERISYSVKEVYNTYVQQELDLLFTEGEAEVKGYDLANIEQ